MKNTRFASVSDAIEDTPEAAENMKLRSSLMIALKPYMERVGLSQSEGAKRFGVTQPRVSDLVRGKINLFGLDALVNMAAAAGLHVEMREVEVVCHNPIMQHRTHISVRPPTSDIPMRAGARARWWAWALRY